MRLYSDVNLKKLPLFFQEELENILDKEGEWSNDKYDHPTKWGIIQSTANMVGWKGNIEDIGKNDARKMWAIHSWYMPRYDIIAQVSQLVCKHTIDTSGPAGMSQANRHLQRLLNAMNDPVDSGGYRYGEDLDVDGLIGNKTAERLSAYLEHRKTNGEVILAMAINAVQLAHMLLTSEKNPGKRDFSYGWWDKRVHEDLVELYADFDNQRLNFA